MNRRDSRTIAARASLPPAKFAATTPTGLALRSYATLEYQDNSVSDPGIEHYLGLQNGGAAISSDSFAQTLSLDHVQVDFPNLQKDVNALRARQTERWRPRPELLRPRDGSAVNGLAGPSSAAMIAILYLWWKTKRLRNDSGAGNEMTRLAMVSVMVLGSLIQPATSTGEERSTQITQPLTDLPTRMWVDDSGYHRTRASLVGIGSAHVRLFKENGFHSTLPLARLSQRDQQYVATIRRSQPARNEITIPRRNAASVIYLSVSQGLLRDLSQEIEREGPVTACVLGVPVAGIARTEAEIDVELVPDEERAVLELPIRGTVHSDMTAYPSILEVYTRGLTGFGKRLRLVVDRNGAQVETVDGWSESNFVTTGISTSASILRRLVLRVATRQVERRKPRIDVAAAQLQCSRIDNAFESAAEKSVKRLNGSMATAIREFSKTQSFYGVSLGYTTSASHLQVVVNLPNRVGLTQPPPIASLTAPLIVRVHSSALPNTMSEEAQQELKAVVERLAPLVPNANGRLREMLNRTDLDIAESADKSWLIISMEPSPPIPSESNADLALAD